jgi:hypothetical protein
MEENTPSSFQLCEPDMARILSGYAVREQILGLLLNTNKSDAIGACVAFLIHAAEHHPDILRITLSQTMAGDDGRLVRMIDVITQRVK